MMKRILTPLFSLVFVLLLMGCQEDDSNTIEDPILGTWRIISIKVSQQQLTQRTPDDEVLTLSFDADGTFSGNTLRNQFGGEYELRANTMTMTSFETTQSPAETPFGTAFYDAVSEALIPETTKAPFGYGFDRQRMNFVFGNGGAMEMLRQ